MRLFVPCCVQIPALQGPPVVICSLGAEQSRETLKSFPSWPALPAGKDPSLAEPALF